MFSSRGIVSPVDQDFVWVAEYINGDTLVEFNVNDKKENSFYDIEKDRLVRFGVMGHKLKLYFEIYRGTFKLHGRRVDIAYKTSDGKIINLSNRSMNYNDIISYKQATLDINPKDKRGSAKGNIIAYYFGYKTKFKAHDVNFNFKAITCVPLGAKAYMELSLVSDKDLNGSLLIMRGKEVLKEINAPLDKNLGGKVNWVVR